MILILIAIGIEIYFWFSEGGGPLGGGSSIPQPLDLPLG
jgi:hypothetical protein